MGRYVNEKLAAKLTILREAISTRPPFCSGTRAIPLEHPKLYFENENQPGRAFLVDFFQEDEQQIRDLTEACTPASFGRNKEDVLDESYRKAGKLDNKFFATNFSPESNGIIDIVRSELLSGSDGTKSIRCEMYKLNVYGKGSFFKPHKDTLRAGNMFGSLVIVYPTKHEGGALALCHKNQEWTFDSAREIAVVSANGRPSVGYAAFFSDVEHEAFEVTSGSRITLTYNLYFADDDKPPPGIPALLSGSIFGQNLAAKFKGFFTELLEDPSFLARGGYLGFGLEHQYPFNPQSHGYLPDDACEYLKGNDAMIFAVAQTLNLDVSFKLLYDLSEPQYWDDRLLTSRFLSFPQNEELERDMAFHELKQWDDIVTTHQDSSGDVNWVTEVSGLDQFETAAVLIQGNEPALDYVYGDFCLLAQVGPPGERATI